MEIKNDETLNYCLIHLQIFNNDLKRAILYLLLFLLPFLIILIVNESVRLTIKDKPFELRGVTAINPYKPQLDECTWYCYRETTNHCKKNHASFIKPYFKYIDPIYFGIIKSMHSGNNYQLMNVVFLVVLIPLLMLFLIIRTIEMGYRIKALKQNL